MTGGQLTTHVLDTASGRPARNVALRLFALENSERRLLVSNRTNNDGRCGEPLLRGAAMIAGVYEIEFDAGAYFQTSGLPLCSPMFLDVVPIRFGLSDPSAHYHVPLLISPFGYSTYRGS